VSRFLAEYPPLFVIAALTLAAIAALWVLSQVLKWVLWLLLIGVLAGGAVLVVWSLLS